MQKITELHIGKVICAQLKKEGRNKKWLAQKVHCEYSCFCKTLKKQCINTELLLRISLALQYDFFSCFSKFIAEHKLKMADKV